MKKIVMMMLIAVFAMGATQKLSAQEPEKIRVYAELLGTSQYCPK